MKLIQVKTLLVSLCVLLTTVGIYAQDVPPYVITVPLDIVPEGIVYDENTERFLVSSMAHGTIYVIDDNGEAVPFIEDENLISTLGLAIDATNNRLWAVNRNDATRFDPTAELVAGVGAFDLTTGERAFYVGLEEFISGDASLLNDITIDDDGNAYITDSFTDLVFRVDANGEPSVLAQGGNLTPVPTDLFGGTPWGLGGIAYHPDGFLLSTHIGTQTLYRIPLDDPSNIEVVETDDTFLAIADGLMLADTGRIITSALGQVTVVTSEDGWATAGAEQASGGHGPVTTLALRDDHIYVLYAFLSNPPGFFNIVRVEFGN